MRGLGRELLTARLDKMSFGVDRLRWNPGSRYRGRGFSAYLFINFEHHPERKGGEKMGMRRS